MKRKFSRRVFMKGAAVAVATSVLAGCSGSGGGASDDSSGSSSSSPSSGKPDSSSSSSSASSKPDSNSESDSSSSKPDEPEEKTSPWTYEVVDNSQKRAVLTGYDASHPDAPKGKFVLPGGVDGYKIVMIGKNAFQGDLNITALEIPATVELIDERAFSGCKNLQTVTMLENDSDKGVSRIWGWAFSGCYKLEKVQFTSALEYIEALAFNSCEMLNNVVIPENANGKDTTLVHCCFEGCTSLVNVYIPRSVKKLDCPFTFPCADKEIFYQGSEEEWEALGVTDKMDIVGDGSKTVNIHYNAKPGDVRG